MKVEIQVDVDLKIYWREPAKDLNEELFRQQAQQRLNSRADTFEKVILILLKEDPEYGAKI